MIMRRKFSLAAAIAAAALSAGGTAVVSLAQNDSAPAQRGDAPEAGFEALQRPQRTDDALPSGVLAKFGPENSNGPRVNPGTARKVARLATGDIYLAEGPDSLCTISASAAGWSGGCSSKANASNGEPQVGFGLVESADGNDYRTWGVAPDTVRSVAVELRDGTRVRGTLTNGAFDITTDDAGVAFIWTDAQRIAHSEAVVLPPQGN